MSRKKKPPIRTNPTENADQAELSALLNDSAPVGCGIIDERLSGVDDDYTGDPSIATQGWERDKAFEEAANSATSEIDRRAGLLNEHYPFERRGSRLVYRGSPSGLYEYMLCLSLSDSYSAGRKAIATRTFEAVSCLAAEAYLGDDAASYRMGWPRKKGSPTSFQGCVNELHTKAGQHCGEWVWGPKQQNPQDPSSVFVKEQGLDVVAWKKSIDGRAGQLYLLGQCACGKNWDSDNKLNDLNFKMLHEWISEISNVSPIRAIFTPRHALDERLPFLSRHGGLVFDRIRITLLGTRQAMANTLAQRPNTLRRLSKACLS